MDIEFQNEYVVDERRTRYIRRFCIVCVSITLLAAMSIIIATSKRKNTSRSSSSGVRVFAFELGNLDGNATGTGTILIETHPEWAPVGVERFHDLVASDYFIDCRFFRVVPNFIVQFGINADPLIESQWREKSLKDDPVVGTNTRGTVTFATAGPGTRTTQLFINTAQNSFLDDQGFAPIGKVISGMDLVDRIYDKWLELPDQKLLIEQGNDYLDSNFPGLSYIVDAQPHLG